MHLTAGSIEQSQNETTTHNHYFYGNRLQER